jgi:hypothetical protein
MRIQYAILLLTATSLFAQDAKQSQPPESNAHAHYRIAYANALEPLIIKQEKDEQRKEKALAEIRKLKDGPFELHTFVEEYAWDRPDIQMIGLQMKYADACLGVYKATVDRRKADLTTRETKAIEACQRLELYPPRCAVD